MTAEEKKPLRLIFMGTPEFALPGLRSLLNAPALEIVAVFTQPDKPVGRKQILTPPPVKALALEHNLKILQPERIKPELEIIKDLAPDLIVVIAYGKIIPQSILDLPRYGCLNVHASLLPKYRGAACLNAPILNGDKETGITLMEMDAGLDTGPILRQAKLALSGQETLEIVHDKLAALGAEILVPTLLDWVQGKIKPQIQDNSQASYIKMLSKEDGRIDWTRSAREIERMVRAYNPWPGTYTEKNNEILKIISVEHEILESNNHQVGELFSADERLAVQCGQDALLILKLQPAGKKIMTAKEYLRGHKI